MVPMLSCDICHTLQIRSIWKGFLRSLYKALGRCVHFLVSTFNHSLILILLIVVPSRTTILPLISYVKGATFIKIMLVEEGSWIILDVVDDGMVKYLIEG